MKFEIVRGEDARRPVAKVSSGGTVLYLQGGDGIAAGRHVALGGTGGNKICVNGTLDVTLPTEQCMADYQDVFEGDTVSITF
jgi:hypothetical protein